MFSFCVLCGRKAGGKSCSSFSLLFFFLFCNKTLTDVFYASKCRKKKKEKEPSNGTIKYATAAGLRLSVSRAAWERDGKKTNVICFAEVLTLSKE